MVKRRKGRPVTIVQNFFGSRLVDFIFGNKLTRRWFYSITQEDENGLSALELALEQFSPNPPKLSLRDRMRTLPIRTALELGRIILERHKDETGRFVETRAFRKAIVNLVRSIAVYGLTKPQRLLAPVFVVWNFTNACNLRCKHCYQSAGDRAVDELSLDEQKRVLDMLVEAGVFSIAFSGGEPFMSPTFWDVLKYAGKTPGGLGMGISIATNGTLITPATAERLAEVGVDYIQVSLDGINPETHDEFRGVPGAWEKTVEGIKNAIAQDAYQVGVACTVTRYNYKELEDLIKFCIDLGVDKFYAYNFIPTGRAKEEVHVDLTPQMREEVLRILYKYASKDFVTMTTAPQYGRVCWELSGGNLITTTHYTDAQGKPGRKAAEHMGGCGVGRVYCAIQPNGIVTPCVYMPDVPIGDLRKEHFRDIWQKSEIIHMLAMREDLKDNCGSCEFRAVCGGCRARAYAYFGDFKAPDPGCIRNLPAWEKLCQQLHKEEALH